MGHLGKNPIFRIFVVSALFNLIWLEPGFSGGETSGNGIIQIAGLSPAKALVTPKKVRRHFHRIELPDYGTVNPFREKLCVDRNKGVIRSETIEGEFDIHWEKYTCVKWTAGNQREGSSKRPFFNRDEAWKYSREFEESYFKCDLRDFVPRTIPLTFEVDFYNRETDRHEGRYKFQIPNCSNQKMTTESYILISKRKFRFL